MYSWPKLPTPRLFRPLRLIQLEEFSSPWHISKGPPASSGPRRKTPIYSSFSHTLFKYILYPVTKVSITVGERGGRRSCSPLSWANLLHSGKFPERTIGNSGNFSDCYPDRLTDSGRNVTAPLNFKFFYAHESINDVKDIKSRFEARTFPTGAFSAGWGIMLRLAGYMYF